METREFIVGLLFFLLMGNPSLEVAAAVVVVVVVVVVGTVSPIKKC